VAASQRGLVDAPAAPPAPASLFLAHLAVERDGVGHVACGPSLPPRASAENCLPARCVPQRAAWLPLVQLRWSREETAVRRERARGATAVEGEGHLSRPRNDSAVADSVHVEEAVSFWL
jgi:hypothetical protein